MLDQTFVSSPRGQNSNFTFSQHYRKFIHILFEIPRSDLVKSQHLKIIRTAVSLDCIKEKPVKKRSVAFRGGRASFYGQGTECIDNSGKINFAGETVPYQVGFQQVFVSAKLQPPDYFGWGRFNLSADRAANRTLFTLKTFAQAYVCSFFYFFKKTA